MDDRSYGAEPAPGVGLGALSGAVLGVVATGAGLAAGELTVGIVSGSSSPVIAVGNKVIDLVPIGLKNWAIETFGTNDKTVLVVTTLALVFVAGVVVGGLAAAGRLAAAVGGTVGVGLLGVGAVLSRPDPSLARLAPILVGTAVSLAVLLWLAPRRVRSSSTEPGLVRQAVAGVAPDASLEPASAHPYVPMVVPGTGIADRRTFVLRSVGVASLAAIAAGTGRLVQGRYSVADERAALSLPRVATRPLALPPNADLDVPGLSPFVIPNDDFYRIDTVLTVPQVSTADWRLRIHGMVDQELELTFDDLLAMDQIERYVTLSCVSNPTGGPYVGNALWQGVRLDSIFAQVGYHPESTQLVSRSVDGWTCGTPVSSLTDGRDAMLAVAMNGEPLPPEHGYPVRMVVPGEYGYVSATKWVVDMEFTTWEAYDAYWVPRGWSQQAPMKAMTRIETPRDRDDVAPGTVKIAGTAWAVHTGVSAVEVRVDGGEWMRARLGGVPSEDTWRKWVVEWDAAESGRHRIEARCIDGDGEVQTDVRADVAPDGASGYHVIDVDVA
jgi:DMSO/TMAO reductase YedYZ molybdopterin-dependent catalytic subunit